MKNKRFFFSVILLCILLFAAPVQAAEYGVIYDETEALWSEELEELGEEILPDFTNTYGIDLRVDVLTGIGAFADIREAAEGLYQEYEYGYGDGSHGVSLTMLVEEDYDGYALTDWYVYGGGENLELTESAAAYVSQAVADSLDLDAWALDLEEDIVLLAAAAEAMVSSMEEFVLAGAAVDTAAAPADDDIQPESVEENDEAEEISVPENWTETEPQLEHVTDWAGLLSEEEQQKLELQAQEIAGTHAFGVYIITVDNYREYTDGDMHDACGSIYKEYSLGLGEDKDGLLLLLSMDDRDYRVYTYGAFGNYAFNQAGREMLVEFFLDPLANNDWYGAFTDYLTWSEDYLVQAGAGTPYDEDHAAMDSDTIKQKILIRIAVILLVPLVIAGIVVLILTSQLKSVEKATEASAYMVGNLHLTENRDHYSHTTESRRKIEKDNDTSSESSAGGSSTGGKF